MSSRNRTRRSESNRNSRIVSRSRDSVYGRTSFTANRDEGSLVAVVNTESNNTTQFVLTRAGTTLQLTGHEARTLFQLLEKHYYG